MQNVKMTISLHVLLSHYSHATQNDILVNTLTSSFMELSSASWERTKNVNGDLHRIRNDYLFTTSCSNESLCMLLPERKESKKAFLFVCLFVPRPRQQLGYIAGGPED